MEQAPRGDKAGGGGRHREARVFCSGYKAGRPGQRARWGPIPHPGAEPGALAQTWGGTKGAGRGRVTPCVCAPSLEATAGGNRGTWAGVGPGSGGDCATDSGLGVLSRGTPRGG